MRAAIVVPTIRREHISEFLAAWREEFAGHSVIVVEDNPAPTFDVSGSKVEHYSWQDIERELGKDAWIIPRRTDCVRSFGYLMAYRKNVEMVVTLDDDCYPCSPNFLEKHYEKLASPAESEAWISTGTGTLPRGMPYQKSNRQLPCVLNHGLWTGVPDLDAVTQLANTRSNQPFQPAARAVPRGMFFPMCGMNLAFSPRILPAMYFLLMGKDWPFDRFGDIWCGIFVKKICDHLGYGVTSGEPLVEHRRASNVWANLRKELPGYEINETFWREIDSVILTGESVKVCYLELAEKLPFAGEYWDRLRVAMKTWAGLFSCST